MTEEYHRAHAVSVAIKKIPGVENVNVSLNKGPASIAPAAGNTVKMEQMRKASSTTPSRRKTRES
ncbi:MAG: hypothetical protein DMG21_13940 [Acidobacteria bacterium]|nr:MAG: hypothetical protein DMG21_13940 [Acidobacteriota bacterium]